MAIQHLPNEVIVQLFYFLSIEFLSNQISIVSHRFYEISQLVLFPSNSNNKEGVKRKDKELYFYKDHFYFQGNGRQINIPIPEIPPPTNWKLGISKFHFNCREENFRQFIQFLADSGQIEYCKIDLGDGCTNLAKFTFNSGYFSPMRGKILEWTINHFIIDDHAYESSRRGVGNINNVPFSHPFLLEISQLILHLDNLVDCEQQNEGLGGNVCTRWDVAEWLGTPLPQNSPYSSRKAFMSSKRIKNITGLVRLIELNYLRSFRQCPFDVFIEYLGNGNLANFLPFHPTNIHSVTGEILQIFPYNSINDPDGNQRHFVVRRCMVNQIAIEPTFYSTEKCCLFQFY